ncbi:MAG: tetratricopeptide repeat protein [Planctomycetota bacterium]|nr:tetratricopeptide repeat protein [Planctomycetota bacterium]
MFALLGLLLTANIAGGQSLDERLDEDLFLRGLIELELPEVLEHYIATHPPADPVQAARYTIAAERLRLRRVSDDPEQRLAVIEQMLAVRGELIEQQPSHPQRALWLADQAADLFFELLPTEAADLTALFGLPTDNQRRRAERVARRMNELTKEAEIEIERAIRHVEAMDDYREDESLQMRRRRLDRDERERRIPFLRGVAAFLQAELNTRDREAREALYETAVRRLEPLDGERLEGALLNRGRLYRGFALARLGRYDDAEALFRQVATDEVTPARDVFAARMGGVLNRARNRGPESALAALDSIEPRYAGEAGLFYRVLIADRRFLLRHRLALRDRGEAQREAMAEAYNAYLDLLEAGDGVGRETMRAIVFARLAQAADADAPLAELPAIVAVARADRLVRREQRAEEAVEILQTILHRPELDASEQAAAQFGLGKALYAANRPLEAAQTFTAMARAHPRDPEAGRSIELAASIAADLHRKYPRDGEVRAALHQALDTLLAQFPNLPGADRWRYAAGRLAMNEGDLDEARTLFARIGRDSPQWPDAQFMRVNALLADARRQTDPRTRRRKAEDVPEAARRAEQALRGALSEAGEQRRGDLGYYLAFLRVFRAEALLETDEPRAALETLSDIERRAGESTDILAAALRVRIEAHQALGRTNDARAEIERLLETAPREAGEVIDSMLSSMLAEVEAQLEVGAEEAARRAAAAELVPLARLLERWIDEMNLPEAERRPLRRRAADVYRLGGRFEDALPLYEALLRGRPDAVELLFGRAECLFGLEDGREAEAMGLYKRLAGAGPDVGHQYYWQSQLRMLQILDRVQENTHRIAPRINRLRLQDPDLGGGRYRRKFQRLEREYVGER